MCLQVNHWFIFGEPMKNSRRQFMILSAAGGCALFAGKQVSAKTHCSAWAKKA